MNNVMPRLCGLVISVLFTIVILMSSNYIELGHVRQTIQMVVLILFILEMALLWRADGWSFYSKKELFIITGMFIYLGLYLAFAYWGGSYGSSTPLLAIDADSEGINRDTLYHNALASSIAAYGFPSLLVNSDAFHNYHFGSHYIFGILSRYLDISTFFIYSYIYPALFMVLYPVLILSVSRQLRIYLGRNETISACDIVALLAFVTNFYIPHSWGNRMADWKSSWFVSESFLVANVCSLIFFYILFNLLNRGYFYKIKTVLLLFIVPIFIIVISLCKISVGAVFVIATIYYLFRKEGCCAYNFFLIGWYVIIFMAAYFIPNMFYSPIIGATTSVANSLSIMNFFLHDVHKGWQFFHLILFFGGSWLFLGWQYKNDNMPKSIRKIIKTRKYIIEETLLVTCIVGYLPGNIIAIGGGSGFYFAAIQQLYATVLLIGFDIPRKIYAKMLEYYRCGKTGRKRIVVFLLVCICVNMCYECVRYCKATYNDISHSYQQSKVLEENRGYLYIINEINKITHGHKEDFYIYVSPSANLWRRFKNPDSAIFFYPAMTGVVCLGELYYDSGTLYANNDIPKEGGYQYRPLEENKKMTEADALAKSKQDGKTALICIYDDTFRVESLKIFPCGQNF